jgi:hypothetical protein
MEPNIDRKKMFSAAIAAVYRYLLTEEEARAQMVEKEAAPTVSPWGHFGRQEMMHMRLMWQRRMVRF